MPPLHFLAFLLLVPAAAATATFAIPASPAQKVFSEARTLCKADGGRLWGVSLCGPIMLADPATHQAVSNVPVKGALRDGALYRFVLPASVNVANAPAQFGGIRWAQIMWPMSGSAQDRAVVLMHESFHRIQPQLGFEFNSTRSISGAGYLDTLTGRVWLRGEMHALRSALNSGGSHRREALADALRMRLYRHVLFAQAAQDEREQDLLEGLAESTGIDAGLPSQERIGYAIHDIDLVEEQPSYVREFPYATGPAYSELLDVAQPGWRRNVTPSTDVAMLAARAYGLNLNSPTRSEAQSIIARYGGAAIESEEAGRAVRKAAEDKKYATEFLTGSTLTLPMMKFSIKFDPRDIEQFESHGSVYHSLVVNSPWGTITVAGGDALITPDFQRLVVPAPLSPGGSNLRGDGWNLRLSRGYKIGPDNQKPGSYTIEPQRSPR